MESRKLYVFDYPSSSRRDDLTISQCDAHECGHGSCEIDQLPEVVTKVVASAFASGSRITCFTLGISRKGCKTIANL